MPLLRCLPLLMHWSCRRKSAYLHSVCRSPGPSLTLSSPFSVTVHFEVVFLVVKIFQPVRSLPLKRLFVLSGRRRTFLTMMLAPGSAARQRAVGGGSSSGKLVLPVPILSSG